MTLEKISNIVFLTTEDGEVILQSWNAENFKKHKALNYIKRTCINWEEEIKNLKVIL